MSVRASSEDNSGAVLLNARIDENQRLTIHLTAQAGDPDSLYCLINESVERHN
jgi:hypothetical protein